MLRFINADADNLTLFKVDSTFCKVQCLFLAEETSNRDGGKNIKVHVLINDRMQLLKAVLTGKQIRDSQPAIDLFVGEKFFIFEREAPVA